MTKIQEGKIICQCGNLVEITIYESINISRNPEFKKEVLSRKINNYYCQKCGEKAELAFPFLYVDYSLKNWIWCYPEKIRDKKEDILKEKNKDGAIVSSLGFGQIVVFGYDEIIEIIK